MSIYNELKRRNVIRVGVAYAVASWVLIQVVETVFPLFGFSDDFIRLVIILLAIGFPLALVFAWIFELTPQGLKLEKDVDRSISSTSQTGRKLDRIIILVLSLGLGYFAIDKFVMAPLQIADSNQEANKPSIAEAALESPTENSIAVLPFVNMSNDADNEYFSDGISEELLNLLAQIPELRVISRTSAFAYKGKAINLAEVARELNVANVLEGSIRKDGNKVRITVQLIEANSDTHLWSETYDRTLDDIFAIQDEIAAVVVDHLKLALLGQSPTTNKTDPEAYATFLQAKHLSKLVSPESLNQAIADFQKVLSTDPNYWPAWVELAVAYSRMGSFRVIPGAEAIALAREANNEALKIAPNSAVAHNRAGWDDFRTLGNFESAARHFERALTLDPSNIATIGNLSIFMTALGRTSDAIKLAEFQASRDPTNAVVYNNLGIRYRHAGQNQNAETAFATALNLNPGLSGVEYELGAVFLQKEDYLAADRAFERERIQLFAKIGKTMSSFALGEEETSDKLLEV